MKNKAYKILPNFLQNLLISIFNILAYRKRYGGNYETYLKVFKQNQLLSLKDLCNIQEERYKCFISNVSCKSLFYKELYNNIENFADIKNICQLPVVNKEMFRQDINKVYTIDRTSGIVSKTGGTTGKSLEVLFTPDNMQERFAMLDEFRSRFGYRLGKKTAWFSGKDLLTQLDVNKNRFWKTDRIYNVRYYSTFHIKEEYLKYYVEDLIRFQPEYFVGFPSTILEIAKFGLENGYVYPKGVTKAIFPAAETITQEMRSVIEEFFQAKMYNQYASSEGAPFIFECENGNLHLELQSGVFEVLDENDKPTQSGRLIVTSFTTEGTPLIRYDIGDSITLEDADIICNCGNNNPLVKEILGRIDDYVYSPKNGKINLGNVSNTLKDTKGIVRFQAIQDRLDEIDVLIVKDDNVYNESAEKKFIQNWRDRIGNEMILNIKYVKDISVEKSGKYRIVKNNIKHLIN